MALRALGSLLVVACGARSGMPISGSDYGGVGAANGTGGSGAGGDSAGGNDAGTSCAECLDLPAPRLIAPLSTASATSRRPHLHWALPSGTDGARVTICRDRACATEMVRWDAIGTSGAPPLDLPVGVVFWRVVATRGGRPGRAPSRTWQFNVGPRSAPVDASWGTTLDVDGDGRADIAIGAHGADSHAGLVSVYRGSALSAQPSPAVTLIAPDGPTAYFGQAVASAGDVNGDGYADLVVGAYAVNDGEGRVYVYFGGPRGLPTAPSATLTSPDGPGAFFGRAVASAGDVNGDGYADIVVGADRANAHVGRAHVYFGGPSGPGLRTTLDGEAGTVGHFGITVASAGDVNGDGYGDLIVGAPTIDRAYLYLGGPGGPALVASNALLGPDAPGAGRSSIFGHALASGDLNGDGYADVVVGAYPGSSSLQGRVYVYPGSAAGLAAVPATTLSFPSTPDRYSVALWGWSDVDADGYADLVVGLPGSAQVRLLPGGPAGIGAAPAISVFAPDGHYFGSAVAGGDVDGDGHADVLVGAYGGPDLSVGDTYTGRVYLYAGHAFGISDTPAATFAGDAGEGSFYGFAVIALGPGPRPRAFSGAWWIGGAVASNRWE